MSDLPTKLFRRRHTFIDAFQQLRFCLDLLLHAMILPLLIFVCFYLEPFASYLLKTDGSKSRAIVLDFMNLCLVNWWITLFALFVLGLISILFSHKIVGPIHHLDLSLKRLIAGEKDVVLQVRDGDYFKNFSNTLADYVQKNEANKKID
jgi:hypothetical protein